MIVFHRFREDEIDLWFEQGDVNHDCSISLEDDECTNWGTHMRHCEDMTKVCCHIEHFFQAYMYLL